MNSYRDQEDQTVHGAAPNVIEPARSLGVRPDGRLAPFLPTALRFREGRATAVAPFFELWATVVAGAANPPGSPTASPPRPGSAPPLVLAEHPIPLGSLQVIRPIPGPVDAVDLDVLGAVHPGRGPSVRAAVGAVAAEDDDTRPRYEIVPPANRTLNPAASWLPLPHRTARAAERGLPNTLKNEKEVATKMRGTAALQYLTCVPRAPRMEPEEHISVAFQPHFRAAVTHTMRNPAQWWPDKPAVIDGLAGAMLTYRELTAARGDLQVAGGVQRILNFPTMMLQGPDNVEGSW